MKHNKKSFWTLDRHHAEGFTLVELIVVIAILAILAGVGIPVYSGYITKANMTADQTLAAEVANALQLQYYADPDSYTGAAYVVLDTNGAKTGNEFGTSAMHNAFGDSWNSVALKHDGWTDAATMLSQVANNQYAGSVDNSTYVTNVGTDKLLGDVQKCASSLAEFLVGIGWSGEESAKALNGLLGGDATKTPGVLENYDGEITADVLANATVFGIAQGMDDSSVGAIRNNFNSGNYILRNWDNASNVGITEPPLYLDTYPNTILTEMANTYAALEGLVGYLDDESTTAIFNNIPLEGSAPHIIDGVRSACNNILNTAFADAELNAKILKYYNCTGFEDLGKSSSSLAMQDGEAYVAIMQTVNNLDDDYVDSLTQNSLFASEDMASRVNSYIAAASLKDYLSDPALQGILNGTSGSSIVVILSVDSNGAVSYTVCPSNANAAG